jgi:hypothetical protein
MPPSPPKRRTRFGPRIGLLCGLALAILLAGLGDPGRAGASPVDLELVLAVDTSMSVAPDEFALQMAGYARAFRHPEVLQAIQSAGSGIAVALVQWGDSYQQTVSVDWTWVADPASAADFASRVAAAERRFNGPGTALASALGYCLGLFDGNGYEGARRVVDVSGDGRDNRGPRVTESRDRAVAAGITVNGLAIVDDEPFLDRYYERQVIGGSGAFVVAAADYRDFAEAIVKKLVREIAGAPFAGAPRPSIVVRLDVRADRRAGDPAHDLTVDDPLKFDLRGAASAAPLVVDNDHEQAERLTDHQSRGDTSPQLSRRSLFMKRRLRPAVRSPSEHSSPAGASALSSPCRPTE